MRKLRAKLNEDTLLLPSSSARCSLTGNVDFNVPQKSVCPGLVIGMEACIMLVSMYIFVHVMSSCL